MIPAIGKLYKVPAFDIYVIFRNISFTRYSTRMSMDLYKDEFRKEKHYDYTLEQKIKNQLNELTLVPVTNKAEMKRRPFDYVDIDGAISLLATRKRYKYILCSFKLIKPVSYISQRYNYIEKKIEQYQDESIEWAGYLKSNDDQTITIKSYYSQRGDITINPFEIEKLEFRLYTFER